MVVDILQRVQNMVCRPSRNMVLGVVDGKHLNEFQVATLGEAVDMTLYNN